MGLTWTGLDELRRHLQQLPTHLNDEAVAIVSDAAYAAQRDAFAAYPEFTGNLKRGLRVRRVPSSGGVIFRLNNAAPHARLFEVGSQGRHRYTSKGYHRGIMPPGRVFWPAVSRAKTKMYDDLIALLRREGLTVIGRAA